MKLTIKDLKELIENLPDKYVVCYEHDGPFFETIEDIEATAIYISEERETITILSDRK